MLLFLPQGQDPYRAVKLLSSNMKGTRESEKVSIETSQILFSSEKLNISRQGSRINFNMPAAIPMM